MWLIWYILRMVVLWNDLVLLIFFFVCLFVINLLWWLVFLVVLLRCIWASSSSSLDICWSVIWDDIYDWLLCLVFVLVVWFYFMLLYLLFVCIVSFLRLLLLWWLLVVFLDLNFDVLFVYLWNWWWWLWWILCVVWDVFYVLILVWGCMCVWRCVRCDVVCCDVVILLVEGCFLDCGVRFWFLLIVLKYVSGMMGISG